MKNRWIVKEKSPEDLRSQFPDKPEFFVDLLWQRGIEKAEEADNFLNPDYDKGLHDPFLLKDIKKASDRVWTAVEKKESIAVWGDYDADGVPASAIMHEFLDKLNAPHSVSMADRNLDGYGLNMEAVDRFISEGVNLIITLDCGTTNTEEIKKAKEAGIDVVVVDHHQVVDGLPPAYAVVNQHRPDDNYPFKHLCAAALTFKFFKALVSDPRAKKYWSDEEEKWLLDLVCIGTIGDMVKLTGENRVLAYWGLHVLSKTRRPGLIELMGLSRINSSKISSFDVGFMIAPRINAAGRMTHAKLAYDLLVEKDQANARLLALEIEDQNNNRKKEMSFVEKSARLHVDFESPPAFVVIASKEWPPATLGFVANRIKDDISRPVMLISDKGEKSKASLRAPKGFDLVKALESISDHLVGFGGHPPAAGCSLDINNLEKIRGGLNSYAEKNLSEDIKTPEIEIDAEIEPTDLNLDNAELVGKLEPFGMGNPTPKFLVKNVLLSEIRMLGQKNQHAKLIFEDRISALMFFHNGDADNLKIGVRYDIVGELSVNEWNGRREPQVKIVDIRKS